MARSCRGLPLRDVPDYDFLQTVICLMSTVVERGEGEGYPSTHWSLIVQASLPEQQAGEGALNQLLARYYAPLRAHLEFRFRLSQEAAEDLVQGFVVQKVLVRGLLGRSWIVRPSIWMGMTDSISWRRILAVESAISTRTCAWRGRRVCRQGALRARTCTSVGLRT